MKQYHTSVIINAPIKKVWQELTNFKDYPSWNPIVGRLEGNMQVGSKISTHIVPLNNTYSPVLTQYKINEEMTWKGVQGSGALLAAEHYYKLKVISVNQVELLHGEYFTGLFSYFLSKKVMTAMHNAFKQHNILLKQRIENSK